jgi:hypothetical protein
MWKGPGARPAREPASRLSSRVVVRRIGLLIVLLVVVGQQPRSDVRFGAVEAYDAPQAASQLGLGWERIRFHWGWVQPNGPDEWEASEFTDEDLAGELAAGREVVALLIGIPDWARDTETRLPSGLYLSHDDPQNTWAAFVRAAVGRYAGQIDHWIIWNEPDVWDANHRAHTWPGTVADFARLVRVAYLSAHQANPDAVLHLPAMAHWWDVEYGHELYLRRLLRALADDPEADAHGFYFDVATAHFYFNPVQVFELIELYRGILAEFGMDDKPLWLVETNAPPSQDPAWPVEIPSKLVSLREQAAYLPQVLALALAAGAERASIYKLTDIETDLVANPEPFGLLRLDGSARPGFETTAVALGHLRGASEVRWVDRHAVARVVWRQGENRVTLVWSRLPAWLTARVPAQTERATLVDAFGRARPFSPQDGYYVVSLPAAECQETVGDYCMIGGLPMYLIEETESDEVGPLGDEVAPTATPPR